MEPAESPLPALPFTLGSKAGAAGWKDGHEAVQSGALVITQDQYNDPEDDLVAAASQPARNYTRQITQSLNLTPRQGIHMFTVYIHAYLNGALDAAAKQAGKSRE